MTGITLADVAKRAGVSTATVSMVLCNKGRISQRTPGARTSGAG